MDGTVEFRFIVLLHYLIIIITKKIPINLLEDARFTFIRCSSRCLDKEIDKFNTKNFIDEL